MSQLIFDYAHLAMLAYAPPETAITDYSVAGYNAIPIHESEADRDEGYLLTSHNRLIIAIRGSDDVADWITTNLAIWQNWRRAHIGFHEAAKNLWQRIRPAVALYEQTHQRHPPIVIVGHSRGGAIGLHLAKMLHNAGRRVELCSFGSPRAGTKAWASRTRIPHCRVVHKNDMVPHLPPRRLGYYHHGKPYVIGYDSPRYGHQAWADLCRETDSYRKIVRLLKADQWIAAHRSYDQNVRS